MVLERVLCTPPLNGIILPGVVRQSIIQIAEQWKEFRIEERIITMRDIIKLIERERVPKKKHLCEIFVNFLNFPFSCWKCLVLVLLAQLVLYLLWNI